MATNVIPDAVLKAAAVALKSSMPLSTWPIGPQLEAWVLLVLGGALQAHANVEVAPPGVFYIRKSQKKAFKGLETSWLEITASHDGKKYELHNALQIRGWSGAHHEVDVCLIRASRSSPPIPAKRLVAGVECKQHQAAIQENIVRTLLGVRVDTEVTPPLLGRWTVRPWAIASTNVGITTNTDRLMRRYDINFVGINVLTVSHTHPDIEKFAARVAPLL